MYILGFDFVYKGFDWGVVLFNFLVVGVEWGCFGKGGVAEDL